MFHHLDFVCVAQALELEDVEAARALPPRTTSDLDTSGLDKLQSALTRLEGDAEGTVQGGDGILQDSVEDSGFKAPRRLDVPSSAQHHVRRYAIFE